VALESAGIVARFKLVGDKKSFDTSVEIITDNTPSITLWQHGNIRQLSKMIAGKSTPDRLREAAMAAVRSHFAEAAVHIADVQDAVCDELNASVTSIGQGEIASSSRSTADNTASLPLTPSRDQAGTYFGTASSPLQGIRNFETPLEGTGDLKISLTPLQGEEVDLDAVHGTSAEESGMVMMSTDLFSNMDF